MRNSKITLINPSEENILKISEEKAQARSKKRIDDDYWLKQLEQESANNEFTEEKDESDPIEVVKIQKEFIFEPQSNTISKEE